jgi:glycosyltransferase involved in cell wall biosynthesis
VSSLPDVAVIVPARTAAATLPATLRALAEQRFDGAVEVVVGDDRSTDATAPVAEAAGVRVVVTTGAGGPAQARNRAVGATTAPLLAFTDADCTPAPGWLAAGVAALRAGAELVQGPIAPTPGVAVGPYDRTLYRHARSPLYETANLFVTRAAFDRAGGFPEDGGGLRLPPGIKSIAEDTLFGWAVRRSGAREVFAPDALVHHAVFPRGPRGYIAERERLRFFGPLVREVPELRDELLLSGLFLNRRTRALDLAVAGTVAALATGRRAPLVGVAPYVQAAGPLWPPRPWALRRFAAYAAADLVGLRALLAGSARARSLVL